MLRIGQRFDADPVPDPALILGQAHIITAARLLGSFFKTYLPTQRILPFLSKLKKKFFVIIVGSRSVGSGIRNRIGQNDEDQTVVTYIDKTRNILVPYRPVQACLKGWCCPTPPWSPLSEPSILSSTLSDQTISI